MALGIEGDWVRARHTLEQGEQIYCSLSWAEDLASPERRRRGQRAARRDARATGATGWRGLGFRDHRWREPIQRSALAIKGLTYMPTGATVAALTTSLPETPGGERNWDYRYTWMRDSTFTLQALHWLDLDWEADEFMQFVADLEPNDDGALQIMYGIDGRRDLTESTRDDLSGYAGAQPGADRQRRLRPAPERRLRRGARLDPAAHPPQRSGCRGGCGRSSSRRPSAPPRSGATPTRASGRRAARRSTTCPRSSCAGSRSTARRSSPRSAGDPELRQAGARPPTRSRPTSSSTALRDGVLRQHYDTDALDASTLLAAIFGFLPGDDERLRKSVEAIADDLTEDGFVLRYRTGETDDGLSGKEGSFLICSFWLVSALAIVGEQQRARDLMERLLSVASPLGLYAEEFDTEHRAATWATSHRRSPISR